MENGEDDLDDEKKKLPPAGERSDQPQVMNSEESLGLDKLFGSELGELRTGVVSGDGEVIHGGEEVISGDGIIGGGKETIKKDETDIYPNSDLNQPSESNVSIPDNDEHSHIPLDHSTKERHSSTSHKMTSAESSKSYQEQVEGGEMDKNSESSRNEPEKQTSVEPINASVPENLEDAELSRPELNEDKVVKAPSEHAEDPQTSTEESKLINLGPQDFPSSGGGMDANDSNKVDGNLPVRHEE